MGVELDPGVEAYFGSDVGGVGPIGGGNRDVDDGESFVHDIKHSLSCIRGVLTTNEDAYRPLG